MRDARGLLAGEVQQDRDVVRAQAPERVLVGAQLAEVQAVAVDVVDVAQLAGVRDLLELVDARVVLQQVPDHEHLARAPRGLDDALGVGDGLGERLLDEAVLARIEDAHGQLGVARHRRGQHDGVELGIGEQIVDLDR